MSSISETLRQQVSAEAAHCCEYFWKKHFAWANGGTHIIGLTPTGRATVVALQMNNEYVVESRQLWIAMNRHPPLD
jgi:hypothetical protein